MSGAPDGKVPLEWTRLVARHHYARREREAMRTGASSQLRDDAAIRYARAVDEMMDDLAALEDQHQLNRITALLSKKEHRG